MEKSAILLILFFIVLNLMMTVARTDEPVSVIESPDPPSIIESGEAIEPQVTIIRQEDKIIEEYKRIKKAEKSNLGAVKKMDLVDKHGRPLDGKN